MIGIGLLGLGTVGSGLVEILNDNRNKLKEILGRDIIVEGILVKDKNKNRSIEVDENILTTDFDDIINNDKIGIIVEVTGDLDRGYKYVRQALEKGKHVITANKAIVSKYFEELSALAEEKGVYFLYEASVGGGIPVLKSLKDQLRIDNIQEVKGILNGTCNFILTKMLDEGLEYEEALSIAQDLGYAEADPSADVEGHDTLRKLRILGTLSLQGKISEDDIHLEGIEKISSIDIRQIKILNKTIKLIGSLVDSDKGYEAIVIPTLVDNTSYYSSVVDAFNIVEFKGNNVNDLKFYGPGAGKLPTANAVLSDLLDIVSGSYSMRNPLGRKDLINNNKNIEGKFYLRISGSSEDLYHATYDISENILCIKENIAVITKEVKLMDIYTFLRKHSIGNSDYFIAKLDEEL